MTEQRFVVRSVAGARIDPASAAFGSYGSRPIRRSYYVMDRLDAWRVIASFEGDNPNRKRGQTDADREAQAEERAAALNAWAEAA
jgi:hypothetical protein